MIAVGDQAPDFTLRDQDGEKVSLSDYKGRKVMLVFYPGDFSPVCGDQLSIYQEVEPEIAAKGVELVGISVDSFFAHKAFQEKLGIDTTLLSDFEPKGEVARAYGSYLDAPLGFANRTLVLVNEDGVVAWTYESPNPGEFPGANVIFDALSSGAVPDLGSAPIPPVGPDDHVRGEGEKGLVVYGDLACPHCAAEWPQLLNQAGRLVFRHFPVASRHPRSPALHAAAEAAGRQGCFFEMVDSLYADRGHVDDPHLWQRVEQLGLELDRFEADRRSGEAQARVRRDFESGIRGGVTSTPGVFRLPSA
jgi:peroxiredoxin